MSKLLEFPQDVIDIVEEYFGADMAHCNFCCDEILLESGFKVAQFEAVRIYCEIRGVETPDPDEFEDAYHGFATSHEEFARERVKETEDLKLPKWMEGCIDWSKVWDKLTVDYRVESGHYFFVHNL